MKLLSPRKLFVVNSIALLVNIIFFTFLLTIISVKTHELSTLNISGKQNTMEGIKGEVIYDNEGVQLLVERREPAIGFPKSIMLAVPLHALRCDIGEYLPDKGPRVGYKEFSFAIGLNHSAHAIYAPNGFSSPKVLQWQTTIANSTYIDRNADGEWDMKVATSHAGSAESLQIENEYLWLEGKWEKVDASIDDYEKLIWDKRVVEYDFGRGEWIVQKLNNEEPTSEE